MLVTITEAAKLAGISRTHLYRKYVKTGAISLSCDDKGAKCIDTAELLRVFNRLQPACNTLQERLHKGYSELRHDVALDYAQEMHLSPTEGAQVLNERIKGLEALLKAKDEMIYANKQELESYKEREQSFRLILEDKRQKKRWWPFSKS